MTKETIAQKLRALRTSKGISQEFLADEAGLSLRTIQRIENGDSKPSGATCTKLAEALKVDPQVLLDTDHSKDIAYLKKLSLSALSFILFPLLGILVPAILWVLKKDEVKNINEVSRKLINFQITWVLLLLLTPYIFIPIIIWSISIIFQIATSPGTTNMSYFGLGYHGNMVIWILMYITNATFIIINTFRIHDQKDTKYYPKIRFIRA
ncbi:helix-turn-helix domain-containing protein [Echinicola marina]|uniref:helix-turn-helix domain-containing protein n=1 Tax=Echinicola marina TaxID=2859768 RepID=UPI001CF6969A|nr:helix-turn-helix domain-containing protein [Echinicola marina]UCS94707.1 helix-turn-helix domain-containing protein [Echinicola marina]